MNQEMLEVYRRLMDKHREIVVLNSAQGVLQWDTETMMPPGAFSLRGEQLALLSKIEHRMITDREIEELLQKAEKWVERGGFDEVQKRNIQLFRKRYNENAKLPERLVEETERQATICYKCWREAKASNDFRRFEPELRKMFELKKEAAGILAGVKGTRTEYDALLDIFEPKVSQDMISGVFDALKSGLRGIIDRYSSEGVDHEFLRRKVEADLQMEIAKRLAEFIGYDISSGTARGRIDPTEHPFTIGFYDDVRITTHYYEENFASSVFSVLHEGGHALYELNLNPEWKYMPVGSACSYGIHESQSRFVENIVGRSEEFWTYFLPVLNDLTGGRFRDVEAVEACRAVNRVRPSKIRIEADEATYGLHIVIRFEMERDLFSGRLDVAELPQVWNEKYEKYLGVKVEKDSEGVLQDVHWAHGYFGYFPSYALGNIYCAQMLARIEKELEGHWEEVGRGNFSPIRGWLKENVHSKGNLYDPLELLRRITGEGINSAHFTGYLEGKYRKIFG